MSRAASADAPADPDVLSVAALDRKIKRLVEAGTEDARVAGEISGLREVASGHAYFTLKDEAEEASIDCVMYRTAPARARRLLQDGSRVVLMGRATLFVPRGRLQLIADDARPLGRGALLEALERLKEKLAAEGLFAADRKRPLPEEPRVIGVVTSGDGAAIHDIIKVATRRGSTHILLARAPVQGASAASRMARALAMLGRVRDVDVIIVGRGGGSADDLAAFNDEELVRAVAASRVPVVSAVGHEIDTTLTDLAADARAATPSQAAELVVPDASSRRALLRASFERLVQAMEAAIDDARVELERRRERLGSPARVLADHRTRLDDLTSRLADAAERAVTSRRATVARFERSLLTRHPSVVLASARAALGPLRVRLDAAMKRRVDLGRRDLGRAAARLDALSPLAVLSRGYAIARTMDGRAIRDPSEVRAGEMIRVRVEHGEITAKITPARASPRAASAAAQQLDLLAPEPREER